MQTFLPYDDFRRSAEVLDYRRLGKQRVEVWQLLAATARNTGPWANHPATRMWRGYEPALAAYGVVICDEWIDRGYRDTLRDKIWLCGSPEYDLPPWLGDERVHRSHRSNLLRKLPEHYGQYFSDVSDDLPYFWPV